MQLSKEAMWGPLEVHNVVMATELVAHLGTTRVQTRSMRKMAASPEVLRDWLGSIETWTDQLGFFDKTGSLVESDSDDDEWTSPRDDAVENKKKTTASFPGFILRQPKSRMVVQYFPKNGKIIWWERKHETKAHHFWTNCVGACRA